jgi:hypothetical protein
MRSDDLEFILCGIADEPTCPALNPSLAKALPAINLIVSKVHLHLVIFVYYKVAIPQLH